MPSIPASIPASTALRPCPSGWPSGQASMPRERLPKALNHRGPSFPGKSARDVAPPQGATSPPGSTLAIQAFASLSRSPAVWPCSSPPRRKRPPRPRRRLPPPPGSRSKPSMRPRSAPRPGASPPPPCRSSSMTARPTRARPAASCPCWSSARQPSHGGALQAKAAPTATPSNAPKELRPSSRNSIPSRGHGVGRSPNGSVIRWTTSGPRVPASCPFPNGRQAPPNPAPVSSIDSARESDCWRAIAPLPRRTSRPPARARRHPQGGGPCRRLCSSNSSNSQKPMALLPPGGRGRRRQCGPSSPPPDRPIRLPRPRSTSLPFSWRMD